MELSKISQKCPLYESNGNTVPKDKDEMVEREFNRLLESTSYLSHSLDFNYCNQSPVSLGECIEWVIKLQEKNVKEKQIKYYKDIITVQENLKTIKTSLISSKDRITDTHKQYKELEAVNPRDVTQEFAYRTKLKGTFRRPLRSLTGSPRRRRNWRKSSRRSLSAIPPPMYTSVRGTDKSLTGISQISSLPTPRL